MGVSVHCGKIEGMDMSYSTFDRWRIQLAKALNENFGNSYEKWLWNFNHEEDVTLWKNLLTTANNTDGLTQELFDFFIMSDCEGEIRKETSKQLLPLIEKLDDEYKIGYLGVCPYSKDYVINFFKHSVRYNAKVWWN